MPQYTLQQHANGIWYIHWTEGRRSKRATTGQKEEIAAQIFLGTWLKGEQEELTGADPLVGDMWSLYVEKHVEKNNVSTRNADVAWRVLGVHFGALTVSQINQDVVDDYVEKRHTGKLQGPVAFSTIRHELLLLRACLNWCADDKRKIIAKSAVPQFDIPEAAEPRDRWLRTEELKILFDTAPALRVGDRLSRAERFLWIALETAARHTAIVELTWDRVDFETGVIHYKTPGRKVTKKKRPSVPISKALRPVLERAYAERISDYVLDTPTTCYYLVVEVATKAGVADVTPHVLRHTAATHMARRGVPLWKIAGILGNSIMMVEKVYAKHCPDGLADAVELISAGALEAAE